MKKGFDRLRGVATASAIGLAGLLGGGGTARAATSATTLTVTVTGANFTAKWTEIGLTNGYFMQEETVSTTGGFSGTANTSVYGISDGSLTTSSTFASGDFYDSGMNLAVGNVLFVNPGGTVDLTSDASGSTVTSNTVTDIIPGVDAQVQYFFPVARPLVRALFTLTNTTGSDITTSALVLGNYGSDSDTTVQATSSGDTTFDTSDQWVVSNDNTTLGGEGSDPTSTLSTWGTGAGVMPVLVMKPGTPTPPNDIVDAYGLRYDVTIPANSTLRVMVFNQMSATIAQATAAGPAFESLAAADAAGLLAGLDAQTQSEIVNYGPGGTVTPSPGKSKSWWKKTFSLDVPGLLVMFGSLLWFRSRARKRQA